MDIQLEKIELIKLLAETENPSIIEDIKKIFQREKKDWWDELSDYQQSEILQGLKEADAGEIAPYENFMEKYL
jgi:uncharacterized protein YehS (DUF1456 family)